MTQSCDILITGGFVIDGTGTARRRADVAIDGGRIAGIGRAADWSAARVIDARGLIVAPRFIDVHTHDDVAVLDTPDMPFKITQGVTTVIAGNCGLSAAPFTWAADLPAPFSVGTLADPTKCFSDVSAYGAAVGRARPAVNVALLAGHSSLRANVMGLDLDRAATEAEIAAMAETLDRALREGAIGFSTGLDYPAAHAAPAAEVEALARVLRSHRGAVYTTHMRDEGDTVAEALREALVTARAAGARIVISHHKCAGRANFGRSTETLGMIAQAMKGQEVALDVYPYSASSSALLERFVGAADRVRVTWSTPHPEHGGRMLDDIAADWGVERAEAVRRLHPAGAIYFDMDEADVQAILEFGPSMVGSDGIPGTERPHPRLWGTFPRVLGHYARDLGLFPLEQAVHKMTGLSARNFGLTDRGEIRPGARADITIFDATTVIDRATFDDPEVPAAGIRHVLVNGAAALSDGVQTGARAGAFLHH